MRKYKILFTIVGLFIFISLPLAVIAGSALINNASKQQERTAYSPEAPGLVATGSSTTGGSSVGTTTEGGTYYYNRDGSDYYTTPSYATTTGVAPESSTPQADRAVQTRAILTLESSQVESDYKAITAMASEFGGYIVSSAYSGGQGEIGRVVLRIPADKFNEILDKVKGLNAKIISSQYGLSDKENEIEAINKSSANLAQQVKDLQTQIAAEPNATKKAELQKRITDLQNSVKNNETNIASIRLQASLATVEVNIRGATSPFKISADWQSIPNTFQFIVIFWIQAAMVLAIPVLIIWLVVRSLRRKNVKVKI